jgi:ATP-binding cassette subfamily B (MDR/TAP) protein 1
VPDISAAKGAATDIINLLDSKPAIDAESTEGKVPKNVEGHVVLQDVHFRYPTRPQVRVLRGLDIEAKPGTYVALVGASGCGKSTVIQLIERFYDPLAGKVMVSSYISFHCCLVDKSCRWMVKKSTILIFKNTASTLHWFPRSR